MLNEIISCLAIVSGVASAISAFASHKSASSAKDALNLQKNLIIYKDEIESISDLIKELKSLSYSGQFHHELSDDKYLAIDGFIDVIKKEIIKLKQAAHTDISDNIKNWEKSKNKDGISIEKFLQDSYRESVLTMIEKHPSFLSFSIEELTKIYTKLVQKD